MEKNGLVFFLWNFGMGLEAENFRDEAKNTSADWRYVVSTQLQR